MVKLKLGTSSKTNMPMHSKKRKRREKGKEKGREKGSKREKEKNQHVLCAGKLFYTQIKV